jgi:hypothetical protein
MDIPSLHTPYNHLGIDFSIEFVARHFNAEVDVSEVMVDCSAAGVSAKKIDLREIDLGEGVLVAAYDD